MWGRRDEWIVHERAGFTVRSPQPERMPWLIMLVAGGLLLVYAAGMLLQAFPSLRSSLAAPPPPAVRGR